MTDPDVTEPDATEPDATEPLAMEPLATGPRGMTLLSVHHDPEDTRFEDAAVDYALVVLWHGDRVLMVHERERGCWELPGGGIEPGETPRVAAARELWEEAGQRVPEESLHFAGFTKTVLGKRRRVLYGAVFTARTDAPQPFVPNSEISAAHWRAGTEPMPPVPDSPDGGVVQTVDEFVVAHFGG